MVEFVDGDLRPLPILSDHPLTADEKNLIRKAKQELDLPFKVVLAQAVVGSPGPVLAIGVEPDWVCDYAPLSSVYSPGLKDALRCVLTGDTTDKRMMTVLKGLQKILGPGVREITDATKRDQLDTTDAACDDEDTAEAGSVSIERGRDNHGHRGEFDPNLVWRPRDESWLLRRDG